MDARTEPGQVRSLSHKQARPIVLGMLLPVFMGSLDNTILASALPTIGREFDDIHDLPWLITIHLLASTAVVPLTLVAILLLEKKPLQTVIEPGE
jgi:MFS family permease